MLKGSHELYLCEYNLYRKIKQQAIELVSCKNARIIGIDDRLETLEKGRWASFICWSGDPFDLASYPAAVYGEGELLFSE